MRTVRARPFGEYFRSPDGWARLPDYFLGWNSVFEAFFYRRRDWFNPLSFFMALGAFALLLAPWRREALVLALSLAVFLVGVYLRTRAIAEGLQVTRQVPLASQERESLRVRYTITNTSAFAVSDLLLRDRFTGARDGDILELLDSQLGPGQVREQLVEVRCDGGMGDHFFGPMVLTVSDPLHVFEFTVTEDQRTLVQVRPEYIPLGDFKIPTSYRSNSFGLYESPVSGQSVNLLGVREYVPGDPLRQVHWKLSARHLQLVVKELENTINTDVTLCVDMNARNHIGVKDASTWEYARDISISLVHECLEKAAGLQFVTQGRLLPFGAGSSHLSLVSRLIAELRPAKVADHAAPLLEEVYEGIPEGSALILVACPYAIDVERLARIFHLLRERAVGITAIWIDGPSFTDVVAGTHLTRVLVELNRDASRRLERLLALGGQLGIASFVVAKGKPLAQSLAVPRVQ